MPMSDMEILYNPVRVYFAVEVVYWLMTCCLNYAERFTMKHKAESATCTYRIWYRFGVNMSVSSFLAPPLLSLAAALFVLSGNERQHYRSL